MIATWDVSGRRVLVTGASSGLGLAMAQALADAGARVALGGRDADRLAHALATIDDPAGEVRPVQIDVRDAASITRAITALDDVWGGLDVLVNNAGLGRSPATRAPPGVRRRSWAYCSTSSERPPHPLSASAGQRPPYRWPL